MKIELLLHHQSLIPKLAELRFAEMGYLVPGKTLEDFIQGLHAHCNDSKMPIAYVALNDGEFLGTFSLRVCDMPSHCHFTPWLGGVLVPSDKRKRGIGAFLVQEAENRARERGFQMFYLFTPDKAAWYAKLGWTEIEYSQFNNIPVTIMQKPL